MPKIALGVDPVPKMTATMTKKKIMCSNATTHLLSRVVLRTALVLFCCCISSVKGEIRSFKGIIEATSSYIHFSEGYLIAPGYLDLSGLTFSTVDDDDDDGGRAMDDTGGLFVDIVFFNEPKSCAYTRSGCDWTTLGVGAESQMDGLSWCCSNDAIDRGLCAKEKYGRLIINGNGTAAFKGQHRFISVPAEGGMETTVKFPKLEEPTRSGKYVLVVANCNDEGRDVMVSGKYTWKSAHGYLPGDLFGEMYFFLALAVMYLILLTWYGVSIKIYEDSIIPIQPWIVGTIGLGFLEIFFKTGDYFVWNVDGTRFWFSMYTGVLLGVMKRSISLCLIVMVSLGWGVIRDSLGSTMKKIVFFGIVYAATTATRDLMTIFAVTENQILTENEEEDIIDIVGILTIVVAVFDFVFYMWILESLGSTMQYLENMNQTLKLKRYLRLRCILLLSILFAVVWGVFSVVDTYTEETMVDQEARWVVSAAMELNYLFVLTGVAILWRPNPSAKDFAFVMELPSLNTEDGELVMDANIPSAADDEDDDDLVLEETNNGVGGYRDDPEDDSLPVDDGVRT